MQIFAFFYGEHWTVLNTEHWSEHESQTHKSVFENNAMLPDDPSGSFQSYPKAGNNKTMVRITTTKILQALCYVFWRGEVVQSLCLYRPDYLVCRDFFQNQNPDFMSPGFHISSLSSQICLVCCHCNHKWAESLSAVERFHFQVCEDLFLYLRSLPSTRTREKNQSRSPLHSTAL